MYLHNNCHFPKCRTLQTYQSVTFHKKNIYTMRQKMTSKMRIVHHTWNVPSHWGLRKNCFLAREVIGIVSSNKKLKWLPAYHLKNHKVTQKILEFFPGSAVSGWRITLHCHLFCISSLDRTLIKQYSSLNANMIARCWERKSIFCLSNASAQDPTFLDPVKQSGNKAKLSYYIRLWECRWTSPPDQPLTTYPCTKLPFRWGLVGGYKCQYGPCC